MSKSHIWFILSLVAFGCLVAGCGPIKPPQASTSTLMLASPTRTPSYVPTRTPSITPSLSRTPTTPPTQVNALTTSPTPWPTVIHSERASSPHIVPTSTKDPREAELLRQLTAAITLQSTKGAKGRPLRQIAGWSQGIASYRWLDNTHLLLYPTICEEMGPMVLPMVMNLNNGRTWMPATDGSGYLDQNLALWSNSLKRLISSQGQEVLLYDLQGNITQRFAGASPLYLSPSGWRLLERFGWHDLETGKTMKFMRQSKVGMLNPAWSRDEIRLFGYCGGIEFAVADATLNTDTCVSSGLRFVDGEGPLPDFHWVLSDTQVMSDHGLSADRDRPGIIALIDPTHQFYVNVGDRAGLPSSESCYAAHIAPDGKHLWVDCQETSRLEQSSYLIDMSTSVTRTAPAKWEFYSWSPDSRIVVLGQHVSLHALGPDRWYRSGERWPDQYALFSVASGDLFSMTHSSITAPVWDPQGKRLAFLTEDGTTLVVLDVMTHMTTELPLASSALDVLWRPPGDGLVLIADGGSLWQVRDLSTGKMEQLTPNAPETTTGLLDIIHIRWSPGGNLLAFITGHDVYVVSVDK